MDRTSFRDRVALPGIARGAWAGVTGALLLVIGSVSWPGDLPAQGVEGVLGDRPLVDDVDVRGAAAFSEEAIREAVEVRSTRCRSILFQPFCWFTEGDFFQERHRLDREELVQDELRVRVFYWLRGYRHTEVAAAVLPSGRDVRVRLDVNEGPPTLVGTMDVVQQGDTALLSEAQIAGAQLPREGEPLDMIQLRLAEDRLREHLWDQGHANAAVDDSISIIGIERGNGEARSEVVRAGGPVEPAADTSQTRVEVRVRPGRRVTVDGVVVVGNDHVSDGTILRALGLTPGEVFRQRDLVDAQRRLYRSALFRQSFVTTREAAPELANLATRESARVDSALITGLLSDTPEIDRGDTTRTVLVYVREAPFDEFGLGAGLSTVDFIQARAQYRRYNFLGGARQLDGQASIGNLLAGQLYDQSIFAGATPPGIGFDLESPFLDPSWSVSLDFTQPWLYSTANSIGLGLFARRRAVLGVVIEQAFGGSSTFSREVARATTVSLGYRYERSDIDAGEVYFCVNFGICEGRTIQALQRVHSLSPLTFSLRAERVDDLVNPRRGFTATLFAEHASEATASDYRYDQVVAETTGYWSLGPGTLAGRIRAGWVGSRRGTAQALGVQREGSVILHPRKRLYSGGARSVRGYGENQLGPRILTVAPDRLTEADGEGSPDGREAVCSVGGIQDRTCDPNPLSSDLFQPRPLGGNRVLEGSIEYRIPFGADFIGAVFVDAGYVGDLDLNIPSGARAAVTPGLGVRYRSPVGVIRLDLGIRPSLVEWLPVVTSVEDAGTRDLVVLGPLKRFDPTEPSEGIFEQIYRRVVLHLSIGEAF